jgi:hypothetical protein
VASQGPSEQFSAKTPQSAAERMRAYRRRRRHVLCSSYSNGTACQRTGRGSVVVKMTADGTTAHFPMTPIARVRARAWNSYS